MIYLVYAFYVALYIVVVLMIVSKVAGFNTRRKPEATTNNFTITGPYKRTKRSRSAWLD